VQDKYFIKKSIFTSRISSFFFITDCLGQFRDIREQINIHYLLVSSLLQGFQFLLLDVSRW